jgi:hypothetical protein
VAPGAIGKVHPDFGRRQQKVHHLVSPPKQRAIS